MSVISQSSVAERNRVEDEVRRLPGMSRRARFAKKAELEKAIADAGFTLRYVDFCEDAETPGLLGYYGGVTMHSNKLVKVSTKKGDPLGIVDRDIRELIAILGHELHHVLDPKWDCGNRSLR